MTFTLAICTYNRAPLLERALSSLASCDSPKGEWELVLVDNNSKDQTAEVARRFEGRLPIRYHFEPTQGLSAARNRAMRECRHEVLLFTDDDLRFERDWLSSYERSFEENQEFGWFGGRVQPWWEFGKPAWLQDDRLALIDGLLVHYDLGTINRAYLAGDPSPFGASFAIRRQLFERLGTFRLDLGVCGDVPARGEEAEYIARAQALNIAGWYVGESSAWHWQDKRRFTLPYLYRYGIEKGIAEKRLRGKNARDEPAVAAELTFFVKALHQLAKGRGDRARQCVINIGILRGLRGKWK